MPRGGARPNAGPKKGAKYARTRRRQAEFQLVTQNVKAHLKEMVRAQIAAAQGTRYLLVRYPDGTWSRPEHPADVDRSVAAGAERLEVFTQRPQTPAFTDLMNRVFGAPPKRLEMAGDQGGPIEVCWRDD